MKCYTLTEIAQHIGAQVVGDGQVTVSSIATLDTARSGQISFLSNPKYRHQLETCQADAVIMREQDFGDYQGNALLMTNPYVGYAKMAQLLDTTPAPAQGIAESAVIDPTAIIGADVAIGANTGI